MVKDLKDDKMNGLIVSFELIQFLHWLITNRKDLLDSIIETVFQDKAFVETLAKISQMDNSTIQQMTLGTLKTLEEMAIKLSANAKLCTKELGQESDSIGQNKSEKMRLEMIKKASLELAANNKFLAQA